MKQGEQYRITRGLEVNPGAREIRKEVFMKEQGFACEFGEEDDTALHVTVYQGEEPVGTARLLPPGKEGEPWHLGRVAVRRAYRGRGIAAAMIRRCGQLVRARGGTQIELLAQLYAVPLYEGAGFRAFGPLEYDEGCPHRRMRKTMDSLFEKG